MKESELLERIDRLPEGERLQLKPTFRYQSDSWGMNRQMVMVSEGFIAVDDLKRLARELESTRAALDKVLWHYADEEGYVWDCSICEVDAMRCLQPTRHLRNLYDVAENGYDFARRVKAEMEGKQK